MTENIYKFFDIDKKASKEEIKKAYRKKSKKTHPDLHPEKREEFEKTNKYYLVLSDPIKRKRYDETGKIDENEDKNKSIYLQFLAKLFKNIIESTNVYNFDIFVAMEEKIHNNIMQLEEEISREEGKSSKYEKLKKRIKCKNKERKKNIDLFFSLIDEEILLCKENIQRREEHIKIQKEAYQYLKEGKYQFEKEEVVGTATFTISI